MPIDRSNPCRQCGACCASYRVDFSIVETEAAGGAVPDSLTDLVRAGIGRMRGTDHARPRCAALSGRIGERVTCAIYEWRPSPCHELQPGCDACNRARQLHGLPAL